MEQDTSPHVGAPQSGRDRVLRSLRTMAAQCGFSWELPEADFDRLTSQPCSYCGTPPGNVNGDFTYTGFDRRDRSLGWTAPNTVSSCHMCFSARGDMPYGDFVAYIHRLVSHQAFRDVETPGDMFGPEE